MDATRSAMEPRYPRAVQLKDGTTVSLRLVSRADADRIVAFARELPPDDLLFLGIDITDLDAVVRWLESADDGRAIVVVAESGGAMAGYAALLHDQVTWQRHLGEIWVHVGPRWRSRGLGGELTREISAIARERGLRKFVARMTPDQTGAISTFERLGFTRQALLQDFVMDSAGRTRDLVLMARDVPGRD